MALAKRYRPKIMKSLPPQKKQQGSSSLPLVKHSGPHVPKARKPQAPPIVPLEVSNTSDTNSGTCSSADISFTGDAFSKRHSGTQEEVQSLATSESDHATLEVTITSALALVTSSTPISSAISSQRAISLANIFDPLQDLDFLFLA
ncbi:hypothetical protein GH714_027015 [Hevea brasiliensis]|uniref:Uncharacterized protein n=1 Tax=Hevea brasiliensis TaxID=3981 RepID=A0A6A6LEN3_HEVBR|nr:hypothetical protein GH714_027015 [Hevea brasiliensis]